MEQIISSIKPDISNLQNCIEDARNAALDNDIGPGEPTNYTQLIQRLQISREKLPPLYQETVADPFIKTLEKLGQNDFNKILQRDPQRTDLAGLMFDIAQSILQKGENYNEIPTDAFQEVVSDLYDGFLSAEDRGGVKPPDRGVIPPLVKWGDPDWGPYTWPVDATSAFGVQAGVVNLPPANARHGLLAWAALSHETGGHDILHADTGLSQELAKSVKVALRDEGLKNGLPEYWSARIDETASDVLGILNLGPVAGIGTIAYFRGLNAAYGGNPSLRNTGPQEDPHPADILRGYLAASTVGLLKFKGAADWAKVIEAETNKDLKTILLAGQDISPEEAKLSASVVANTIVSKKMQSLESHALGDIQNWHNQDEKITQQLRTLLASNTPLPTNYASNIYAAHAVAAAVLAALSKGTDFQSTFNRMQLMLKTMHDSNPSWGPLYVSHPGNIVRRAIYKNIENNKN